MPSTLIRDVSYAGAGISHRTADEAGGSSSVALGPNPATLVVAWRNDRLDGKPMANQYVLLDLAGQARVSGFEDHVRTV